MEEIAPGVHVGAGARRVLYAGDPGEAEFRNAAMEIASIRSELSELRHRLRRLGELEGLWFDSHCNAASGSITMMVMALYELEVGDRSFSARSDKLRELWADVEARPERYVIKEGKRKDHA